MLSGWFVNKLFFLTMIVIMEIVHRYNGLVGCYNDTVDHYNGLVDH